MRKCTAIFFLVIFLFSNTELHELGKIGAFVGHFMEHKAGDPQITLLEFIAIHYFSGNVRDADYARDMQLPFKVIDCAAPGVVFTLPQEAVIAFSPAVPPAKSKPAPHDPSRIQSLHFSDIWQPPKSC